MGKQVAANVTTLREQARIKQQDLAERVQAAGRQMSGSAISKIEKLDRRIDVDDLHALAQALNVPPAALLVRLGSVEPVKRVAEFAEQMLSHPFRLVIERGSDGVTRWNLQRWRDDLPEPEPAHFHDADTARQFVEDVERFGNRDGER